MHVAEPGYGVAIANDSTYGYDVDRTVRPDGGSTTTLRFSLIRGPKFPDPDTDQGQHRLQVSLVVGADIADAVLEGQQLNQPLRHVRGAAAVDPLVSVDPSSAIVEAVKLAEDGSGDVVVRIYEPLGRRATTPVGVTFGYDRVVRTDLLERETGSVEVDGSGVVGLTLRPFEIVTLRFVGASAR